jgi:Flp pilus assembly protein CpaB
VSSTIVAPRGASSDPLPPADDSTRVVDPKRRLPGGRAILGGVLVACAALGLFAATRTHSTVPSTSYLVARRPLTPGHRITASDLTAVPISLPASVAASAKISVGDAIGEVVLQPIAAGALVTSTSLTEARRASSAPLVSFSIEPDRAAAGDLVVGDHVEVFATWDGAADNTTERVAHDLEVVAVSRPDDNSLSGAGHLTISVTVPTGASTLRLVRAIRSGELTVVRTTGSGPSR